MIARPAFLFIGLAALAVSLGGCGRKGPLDLPPTAQAQPLAEEPVVAGPPPDRGSLLFIPDSEPVAAPGRKRRFILDPLLGN